MNDRFLITDCNAAQAVSVTRLSKPRAYNWWLTLSLIWIGSAAMFTWSGWEIFTSLGVNSKLNSPAANLLRAIKICAALLLAVTSAFVVVQGSEKQG